MTAEVNHRRDGCNPRFRQELFKDKTETQGSENSKPLRLSRGLDRDSVGVVEKFNKNVVPLVQHCHALGEQNDLPPADMQSFVTEDKNMLGSSGVNPFPPSALIAPMSEDEIVAIVKKAYATRSQVRVIGSAHSSPSNIIVDAPHGVLPPNVVLITLTKYRGVTIDKVKKFATVKAGTNLDIDPEDSDSTQGNSLAFQLQNAGFALPVTGGITHQTIAGFLATGSAGGSLLYSFHDAVYGFTLIDGTGTKHVLSRDDTDPTLFFATGVSVGLCGIITEVTLSLTPTFDVMGVQQTSLVSPLDPDWTKGCPVNLCGPASQGVPGIEQYFKDPNNEYMRMRYWPQVDLPPRVQIWTGKRTILSDTPKPFQELDLIHQFGAMTGLWLLWQMNYFRDTPVVGSIGKKIAAKLLDLFIPLKESIPFVDLWSRALPMDNSMQDTLMPSCFTEFWFDMDKAADAVSTLKALHLSDSSTIGNFFTEFYAAKKSPFWLSSSFTGDKFRLDVNLFQYDMAFGSLTERYDPADFFRPYFEYFDKHGPSYRCHLGKYIAPGFGDLQRLRRMYPKYDEWMQVRARLDPRQIFVNPYWRKHFLIPPAH